ncbi:MAG: pur operon repressor [Eubacteriales bacterium]
MKKTERIVAITEILLSRPNELIALNYFGEKFSAAKSTISEDLVAVRDNLRYSGRGFLETISGAAGGVKFLPGINKDESVAFLDKLAEKFSLCQRLLPGGFLYMTDILFNPEFVRPLGLIFAEEFRSKKPETIVTIETKGIPLALMTADALGIPSVVIRHGNKVTEGSSVSINYISGSSKRIQTMSLNRRALEKGRKVLIIDDYMKAGGTAKGIISLMEEFEAEVVGLGILMEEAISDRDRLVDNYKALLQLQEIDYVLGKAIIKALK